MFSFLIYLAHATDYYGKFLDSKSLLLQLVFAFCKFRLKSVFHNSFVPLLIVFIFPHVKQPMRT